MSTNTTALRQWLPPAAWRMPLLAWLAAAGLLLLAYLGTARAMVEIWQRSETFAHAFVVPPLSIWLVWRMRGSLSTLQPRPAPWMALPLILMAFLWRLGDLVQVNALQQFMLVGMLVGTVPAVLGWQVARALMFPLGFLFFAVPFGEFLTPWLVQYTADFTVAAVRLSGVPVFREGNQFVIPSGRWSVVEACSGIRYLMASVMVGTLFAYLNYRSMARRWAFVAVSVAMPILANWLRAYMIVMIGHLSDNRLATGVDHLVYGWVFFGIVITAMFLIGARWAQDIPAPQFAPAPAAGVPRASRAAWLALVVVLTAVVAPAQVWRLQDEQRGTAGGSAALQLQLQPPGAGQGGWRAAEQQAITWVPAFVNASATVQQAYTQPSGRRVELHLFYYRQQHADRKMVSSINVPLREEERAWNALGVTSLPVDEAAGEGRLVVRESGLLAAESSASPNREQLLTWQLYWVNGAWTASDVRAKLLGAWVRLRGQPDDSAILMLSASQHQPGGARPALQAFLQANRGSIEAALVAARDSARAP